MTAEGQAIYNTARARAKQLNIYDIHLALRNANGESERAYRDELGARTAAARIWLENMLAQAHAAGEIEAAS